MGEKEKLSATLPDVEWNGDEFTAHVWGLISPNRGEKLSSRIHTQNKSGCR